MTVDGPAQHPDRQRGVEVKLRECGGPISGTPRSYSLLSRTANLCRSLNVVND